MKYEQIKKIADKYVELLKPLCERIQIAGSIRRKKAEPNDIEICCIENKTLNENFFEDILINLGGKFIKNGKKYKQILLPEGVKLDLFICSRDNWGLNFAIRTGSAEFSHKVLARRWCELGYKSEGAILQKGGKSFPLREEIDVFKFLGLKFIPPEERI